MRTGTHKANCMSRRGIGVQRAPHGARGVCGRGREAGTGGRAGIGGRAGTGGRAARRTSTGRRWEGLGRAG